MLNEVLDNFVASKLKVIFPRFATSRLISITDLDHHIGVENSVNSVGTLRVRSGKESLDSRSY